MANPLIYTLVAIFGSSSWLSINSVWLELSLLAQALPEGWSLPSYLTLTIQLACVAPLIYTLLLKCANVTVSAPPLIFILMLICTAAEFLLAFFWDQTFEVFGNKHSVVLMILLFVMAMVNATSNVLFMPYMAAFHPNYLTAYFVGMGLSSLVPSIVSLLQGTSQYTCIYNDVTKSKEPLFTPARFQVRDYTLVMGVWMAVTLVAFCVLHVLHDRLRDLTKNQAEQESSPLRGERAEKPVQNDLDENRGGFGRYCILLACLAFVCAQMNAIVPSIQIYATLSYSQLAYHLALALSSLSHPVASFLPMWIQPRRLKSLLILTLAATVFCGIIVLLALQSPTPIGHNTVIGSVFTVVISIVTAFLHAYLRTVLTTVLREDAPENESRLFWCGLFMQVGSFLGSGLMFPLVNVVKLFKDASFC
ncbi:Riboflavin transporter [Aphelenchoides bicaudatus]|nr:Riboflavin transporter [Aphelenchoides bicaudatus]